jgi:predicted ATPase
MKPLSGNDQLSRFVLKGFKSIANCDLNLGALNILIGPNGAGKSNFIEFFNTIQQILEGNLQLYVGRQGGPDALLHFGRKKTEKLEAQLYFGNNGYWCTLEPTKDNRLMFANESFWWNMSGPRTIGSGHFESYSEIGTRTSIDDYVRSSMQQWRVYHFHDTGDSSLVKQRHAVNDNSYFRPDARNLAAYLSLLKQTHPGHYRKIVNTIRLAAPFFGDFHLRPQPDNKDMIELEWIEKDKDVPFKAHHLSDGTLRFICLTTLLLQPVENQPATILIDEPELGLHPYAITVLTSLLKSAALKKQIIVSTQSVELVSEFDAEDLVVVDRKGDASVFSRLDVEKLQDWLQEYSLGELWKKNIFGGRPSR